MSNSGARSPGAPPNSTVRVLEISDDPQQASSRLLILQNAGFLVEHRFSSLARSKGEFHSFHVIILCQSLRPKVAEELAHRICAVAPDTRILRVRDGLPDQVLADTSLSAPVQPKELVRIIRKLVQSIPQGDR